MMDNNLLSVLNAFEGAKGNENKLEEQFLLIAKHLLYGGYFEVSGDGLSPYRIYLHTIEFYYHEEHKDSTFKDYIVYHRNTKTGNPKPAFRIGCLNAHVSGIDITFEDNNQKDNPEYRASALIRAFMIKDIKDGKEVDRIFDKPKHKDKPTVEAYPLHLYDYLFMQSIITDIRINWIDIPFNNDIKPYKGQRVNVYKYNNDGIKLTPLTLDGRMWAYSIDPFKD